MKTLIVDNNYLYQSESRLAREDRPNVLEITVGLVLGMVGIIATIVLVYTY